METWEYHYAYWRIRPDQHEEIEAFLNEMGAEGWQLIQVFGGVGYSENNILIHSFVFKRLLPAKKLYDQNAYQ